MAEARVVIADAELKGARLNLTPASVARINVRATLLQVTVRVLATFQSSNFKPAIRENSFVLWVTKVQ